VSPRELSREEDAMKSEGAERLRAAVRALGRRRRNDPVPLALRRKLVRYAQARRRAGVGWWTIGRELGVSGSTLRRWWAKPGRAVLRPVRVTRGGATPKPANERWERGLVVVTAAGHRVEGLAVGEATLLLRALG
jgi:hypothetical protein